MGNGQTISENMGLRVISVQDNSPGQQAGLIPFMDFIISVDKKPLETLLDFSQLIKENEEKTLVFEILNIYKQTTRLQQIKLTRNWEEADGLIGIKVRVEHFFNAVEQSYKILKVNSEVNSLEEGEYLLGTPNLIIETFDDFELALTKETRQEMAIYNNEKKELKLQIINCGRDIGIGCEVGQGKIHELKIDPNAEISVIKIKMAEEINEEQIQDLNEQDQQQDIFNQFEKPAIPNAQINSLQVKRNRKGSHHKVLKDPFQLASVESNNKEENNEEQNSTLNAEKQEDQVKKDEDKESIEEIVQLDSEQDAEELDSEAIFEFYCEKYQRNYRIRKSDLFELSVVFDY